MKKEIRTALVTCTALLLLVLLFLGYWNMKRNAGIARLDVPETECEFPIYTSQGDYALCIK